MTFLFVAGITLVLVIAGCLLNKFSGNDLKKIYKWSWSLHLILLTCSFIMWFYESSITGIWFYKKSFFTFIFYFNLFIFLCLIILRPLLQKAETKNGGVTKKYNIKYYEGNNWLDNYARRQAMTFFILVFVAVPIINIYAVIQFVKQYLF